MIRNWDDLPANAQTVAVVESCISYLQDHHPYPANMKIDRTALNEMADEEEVI
jgi:hypothetical protein